MSLLKKSNQNLSPFLKSVFRDDFWDDNTHFLNSFMKESNTPKVNIKESEESYTLELAVPGKRKDDFSIEVDRSKLIIFSEEKKEEEETKDQYTRKEYNYKSFQRSFQLPEDIKHDAIQASYDNGVLTIEIPKTKESIKKIKSIQVS